MNQNSSQLCEPPVPERGNLGEKHRDERDRPDHKAQEMAHDNAYHWLRHFEYSDNLGEFTLSTGI